MNECCKKSERTISDHLINQTKRHEGKRLKLYKCPAKKWTIGYGHNVEDDPNRTIEQYRNGITEAEAEALLMEDLENARDDLFRRLPEFKDLKPARIDALVNLVFNMGIGTFAGTKKKRGFRNTILAIRHGDFKEAKRELFDSKWRKKDVSKSRSDEIGKQLETGVYA